MKYKSAKSLPSQSKQKLNIKKTKKQKKSVTKLESIIFAYDLLQKRFPDKEIDDVLMDFAMKNKEGIFGNWREPQQYSENIKNYMRDHFQFEISEPELAIIKSKCFEELIYQEKENTEYEMNKLLDRREKLYHPHPLYPEYLNWGFDITYFGFPENFQQVLELNGLDHFEKIQVRQNLWNKWTNKDKTLELVTERNPLTDIIEQEPFDIEKQAFIKIIQKGVAGFIGISGKRENVLRLASTINAFAPYVKEESPLERSYG